MLHRRAALAPLLSTVGLFACVPFTVCAEELDLQWVERLSKGIHQLEQGQYKKARKTFDTLSQEKVSAKSKRTREVFESDLAIARTLAKWEQDLQGKATLATPTLNPIMEMQLKHPSSALLPALPQVLARFSIRQFNAAKAPIEKVQTFIAAAERVDLPQPRIPITPAQLGTFAQACKSLSHKKGTLLLERCQQWTQRLIKNFGAGSPEGKALTKGFPDLPPPPPAQTSYFKPTQNYKSSDKDQTAFDDLIRFITQNDTDAAVTALSEFLAEYPQSAHRTRARFWLLRLLKKTNQRADEQKKLSEQIQKDAPFSFHALMASQDEGRFPWELLSPTSAKNAAIEGNTSVSPSGELIFSSPEETLHAIKIDTLARLKRPPSGWIEAEIESFKSRAYLAPEVLERWISATQRASLPAVTLSLVTELIQRQPPNPDNRADWISWIFPIPESLWNQVQKIANQNEVDPILILSLIKQESAFNPKAASHAGAWGLMQLMPFTALEMNPEMTRLDLLNPESNMRAGTGYFKKLLKRYSGSVVLALAAYNAGPNAVNRWIKEGKLKNGELLFAEQIPYKETRDYVFSILRNHAWYQHLLKAQTKVQVLISDDPSLQLKLTPE